MKLNEMYSDIQSKNIGDNTRIWQFVIILPLAQIGNNCNICSHCFIENDVVIGNNVTIKNGVRLYDGTRIADFAFIGPNVVFTNDKYPPNYDFLKNKKVTTVKERCSNGAGALIMPGLTLGEGAIIGAGSVVTRDVPDRVCVIGNPARIVRHLS